MEETILSAPEMKNVSDAFLIFKLLPGNEVKTMNDFYSFLITPSVDRDNFLSNCELSLVMNGHIMRQQFEV